MSKQVLTFTAGQKKYLEGGNFLRVDSSTGELELKFLKKKTGTNEEHAADQGDRFKFMPEPGESSAFDSVEVYSATAQTVTITISGGEKDSDKVAGSIDVQPGSAASAADDVSCPTGAATQVIGENLGRKRVHVTNMGAGTVRWSGVEEVTERGSPIYPGVTAVIENTTAIYIRNDSGASVDVAITEES